MAFASIISMIGSLPERLDKIADIRFRMRYSSAHGLSPCETQYGFVTFIIALLTVLKKMDIRSVHAESRLKAAYL